MFTPVRESGGRSLAHRVERTADRRFIRRVCDQTKIMLPDQVSRIAADQPQNRPAGRDVSLKLGRNRQIKFRLQRDDQYIGFRKIFRASPSLGRRPVKTMLRKPLSTACFCRRSR